MGNLIFKTSFQEIKSVLFKGEIDESVFPQLGEIIFANFYGIYKSDFKGIQSLQGLKIEETFNEEIDFRIFAELEDLEVEWNRKLRFDQNKKLKFLLLRKYKEKSILTKLPSKLQFFEIIKGKLENLIGIEQLKELKGLELSYLPKLTDIQALTALENLTDLVFVRCMRLRDLSCLKNME